MKITSLDIRKQEFNRSFRGYDIDEVDSFLQVLATQWQEIVDDLRRSGEKVSEQQLKLDHYMKVEEALEEALQTARSSARITIENAEMKARNTLEEAENRVVDLQKQSDSERLQMKRDTAKYAVRQQEIVAKLRAFLMSEMEILGHFDAENIRPKLSSSVALKEIELVRDESIDQGAIATSHIADQPTDLEDRISVAEKQIEIEQMAADPADDSEMDTLSSESEDRQGSRSSWEKIEGETSVSASPKKATPSSGAASKDWDEEDDDEADEDEDWDLGDDDDDDGEDEEGDYPDDGLQQNTTSALEVEELPSWRFTPIFGSVDESEDDDQATDPEPPSNYRYMRFPDSNLVSEEVGVDDETEAEIRKIHQILKDLDDE